MPIGAAAFREQSAPLQLRDTSPHHLHLPGPPQGPPAPPPHIHFRQARVLPLPHESELVSPLFKPFTGFSLKTKPDSDDLTPVPPTTLSPSPTPAYSPAATGASFLLLKQTPCPLRSLFQAVTSSGRPTLLVLSLQSVLAQMYGSCLDCASCLS